MSIIILPAADSKFATGQPAYGTDITQNVNTIVNDYNGGITNSNISNSAAITDTKLDQITTTGKVSGTAITTISSLPSAAGTVPSANIRKTAVVAITAPTDIVVTGTGLFYFTCPAELNGMNLVAVGASVLAASSSGTPTVQIAKGRRSAAAGALSFTNMLTTLLTIDALEFDSANATAPAVISAVAGVAGIVVSTYVDVLRIDVTVAGTNAAGLECRLSFQTP